MRIVNSSIGKFVEIVMARSSGKFLLGASCVGLIGFIAICGDCSPVLSADGVSGASSMGIGTSDSKELLQRRSSANRGVLSSVAQKSHSREVCQYSVERVRLNPASSKGNDLLLPKLPSPFVAPQPSSVFSFGPENIPKVPEMPRIGPVPVSRFVDLSSPMARANFARTLMNEKKYLKALPILNSVLKDSPTNAEFWFKYGECQFALQDDHEALAAFEMTKKLAPEFAGVCIAIEAVKKRIQDEQVRKSSESAAAEERQREEERIATLINAGSYRTAADSLEKMLAAFPVNAKGWFYLGVCRQALSEFHAALAAYEMSLRISPTSSEAGNVVSQLRTFFQEQGQPGTVPPALPLEVNLESDFSDLQSRITRAWFPPRVSSDRQTTVLFFVHHDGTMAQLRLISSSGLATFDQAALKAIEAAAPFRPLPCAFGPIGGIRIEARFHRLANPSCEWISNLTLKRIK